MATQSGEVVFRVDQARLLGCNFHWKQAVFRKVHALRLVVVYNREEEKWLLMQQVMALSFLSIGEVVPAFERLRQQSDTPVLDESDNDSDLWDDSALIKAYDKAISYVKGMTNDGSEKDGKNKAKKRRGGKKNKKKHSVPTQSKWKVGDRCRSVFSEDDQVYSAVVKAINNKKASCIVRYTDYGNEEEKRLSDLFTASEAESIANSRAELENGYDSMEWAADFTHTMSHPTSSDVGPRKRLHHPPHPPSHHPLPHPSGMPHPPGYPSPFHGGSWYPPHPPPPMPPPPPPSMMSPLPFAPWGSPAPQMPNGWGGVSPHPAANTPPHIPSMSATPPPHPPLPEDIEEMDKEALHSMLMSWYMSGYHTGYYEGIKKSKSSTCDTRSKERSKTKEKGENQDTLTGAEMRESKDQDQSEQEG